MDFLSFGMAHANVKRYVVHQWATRENLMKAMTSESYSRHAGRQEQESGLFLAETSKKISRSRRAGWTGGHKDEWSYDSPKEER